MPEHLKHRHDHKDATAEVDGVLGLWSQIAKEAERSGFGNLEKFELAAMGL